MNDILANLIVIAVLGVLGLGAYLWFARRSRQRSAQLLAEARRRGWQAQPFRQGNTSGYRFSANEAGLNWQMEARVATTSSTADGSTSAGVQRQTVWRSPAGAIPDGLILLGPAGANSPLPDLQLSGLGGMLLQTALRGMLGEDAAQMDGLHPVPLAPNLSGRYSLWAHDETLARQLMLAPEVGRALSDWPAELTLVARLERGGVTLTVQDKMLEDAATLAALAHTGVQICRASAQAI